MRYIAAAVFIGEEYGFATTLLCVRRQPVASGVLSEAYLGDAGSGLYYVEAGAETEYG